MQLCNETFTLYNAGYDFQADMTVYNRTVLTGVHSYTDIKSTIDSNGLKSANAVIIRIPADVDAAGKSYADPITYTGAGSADGLFTLNEGDFLIPGSVGSEHPTLREIHSYHGAMTILGVTDNRRAPNAPHWKVVGA